jgi:Holliday junction resolvase RusA-like endonuclease
MTRIVIRPAGVPVGKGRPRFLRLTGGVYTPPKTRAYEQQLAWASKEAMRARPPWVGPIRLEITAYMPIPASWPQRRRSRAMEGRELPECLPDADNVLKIIADALNGIVFVDDRQVFDARIRKFYAAEPSVEITVETIDPLEVAAPPAPALPPIAAAEAHP